MTDPTPTPLTDAEKPTLAETKRKTVELSRLLALLDACEDARRWADDQPLKEAWFACERGDWLLWAAAKLDVDRKLIVSAGCDCAELSLKYVLAGEDRPRKAIEASRAWVRGEATIEQVRRAAADAAVAAACAAAAADDDAYAAYAAAYAAADAAAAVAGAAVAAAADAVTYTAYAAYAATAVTYAVDAVAVVTYAADAAAAYAAYAADDAYAYAAAYAAARVRARKQCADIARKHISWAVMNKAINAYMENR